MCDCVSESMPAPVSLMETMTYSPAWRGACTRAYSSSSAMFEVSMVSLPPEGMASRAFTARFMMTCSICPASARTDQRLFPGVMTRSISSPIMRVSILRFSVAMSLRLTIRGASICFRLNANNWRVKDEARSEALAISWAGPRR